VAKFQICGLLLKTVFSPNFKIKGIAAKVSGLDWPL
jgi:hypothetical protein